MIGGEEYERQTNICDGTRENCIKAGMMYCDIFEETCIGFQVPDNKQWIEGRKGVELCKGLTQIDDGQRWSFFIKINVTK